MSGDKILAEERWSHVLFRRGEVVLLTLITGGVVQIDCTVVVPKEEAMALSSSPQRLKAYVQALRSNGEELLSRRLPAPVWPGDATPASPAVAKE